MEYSILSTVRQAAAIKWASAQSYQQKIL